MDVLGWRLGHNLLQNAKNITTVKLQAEACVTTYSGNQVFGGVQTEICH